MPTTIGVKLILSTGKVNLSLWLYSSGVLLNTGGDALVEIGASGFFEASVDEAIIETLDAIVLEGAVAVYGGTLYLGQTQVDRMASVDLTGVATEAKQDAMAGATFDTATDSLEAIRAAIEPTLTGPWTRTITVTDSVSGDPIQNATVRFFRTGETETQPTNVSGVASFTVEAATWSYAIVASGYAGASGTVVVSGSGGTAVVLVLTAVVPPSSPSRSVLQVLCLDEDGDIEPAIAVDIRIVKVPSGDTNIAYKGTKQTAISDVNGIARFEAIKSATYQIKRGTADEWDTIIIGSGDTTSVTSFIGSP